MALQNLPIGIQSFEKLRDGNYLYIDKTELIYRLVSTGSYYFLSRPRRFGKSLLVSTLKAYFEGKKNLFRGLKIMELEKEWESYPILHLDLNTEKYDTPEALTGVLGNALSQWESLYGADASETSLSLRFLGIIRRAYEKTGKRVVILVDEYDKPLLQAIDNDELQEEYRNTLKAFYGALKSDDQYIRFALLTGVTKFGKISVFSDLNNLKDISMRKDYHEICGISNNELTKDLAPYLLHLGSELGLSADKVLYEMKKRYDGYHFTYGTSGIYNPFSVLNAFDANAFGNYWFETGTPSYLVYMLKQHKYTLSNLTKEITTEDVLNSIDSASEHPIPVIYQSGYLTIKDYDPCFKTYTLGFPNEEVEEGFMKYLLPFYASVDKVQAPFQISRFVQEIRAGQTENFLNRLKSFFSDVPYELVRDLENHYQNVLFIVTKLMGFYVQAEYRTSNGRIDMVLQTNDYTYVMEFKLDGTAEEALQQITDKSYTMPFDTGERKIIRIGINFSSRTRNIEKWIVE